MSLNESGDDEDVVGASEPPSTSAPLPARRPMHAVSRRTSGGSSPFKAVSRKASLMREMGNDAFYNELTFATMVGVPYERAVRMANRERNRLSSMYDSQVARKTISFMNMLGYDLVKNRYGEKVFRLDRDGDGYTDVPFDRAVRDMSKDGFRSNFGLTAAMLKGLIDIGCSDYRIMVKNGRGGNYVANFTPSYTPGGCLELVRSGGAEKSFVTCGELYSMTGIHSLSMAQGSRIPVVVSLDVDGDAYIAPYACADVEVEHGPHIVVVKNLSRRVRNFFR